MTRFEKVAKAATRARAAARETLEQAELKLMAAEGRRSVKARARTTAKVATKAAKTGAIAGAVVATAVVVREIRKRRKLDA